LLLAGAGATLAVKRYRTDSTPLPKFETTVVDKGQVTARVTATGTLSALVTVQVGSQVSGRIQALGATFNDQVKKGQVIAKIDPELLRAALEQARANNVAAKGNLAKSRALATDAERQAARSEELAERNLIAVSERDTAKSNAEAARAQVAASEGALQQTVAALHTAQVNLNYTTIVSPIDGMVISRSVDVGQTVAASLQAPTLFTIAEDLRKMQVDTNVSEADVGKLQAGMAAAFSVDAYPSERFRGRVRQVRNAPQTVQNVVTYDAVIDVDNAELKLKPGMTASVTFIVAEHSDVVRVPNAALRFRPPTDWVAKASEGGTAVPGVAATGGAPPGSGTAAGSVTGSNSEPPSPAAPVSERSGRRGGGFGAGRPDGARTIWLLVAGVPQQRSVRVGITDGTYTELLSDNVSPGDTAITGLLGEASATDTKATPFSPGAAPGGRRMF
jgi:HlyD family secretion protein